MGSIIIRAHQKLILHIVQCHIHAGHPEELSLRTPDGGYDADHHNVFSHQFIYIGIHNVRTACVFDFHIIFFFKIVKSILMLFKDITCFFFILIHHSLISNISVMDRIRFSRSIRYDVLLKICKPCGKPVAPFQKPHQSDVYGIPLLPGIQCGIFRREPANPTTFP